MGVLKAVDKMIVMGSLMDGAALQQAARAHVRAIQRMDSKGVLTQGDFEAILAGLGQAISSVSERTVMDVYNAMSKIVGPGYGAVPMNLFSKQNPADAKSAYIALMQFKDTVKEAQPSKGGGAQTYDSFGAAFALLGLGLLLLSPPGGF